MPAAKREPAFIPQPCKQVFFLDELRTLDESTVGFEVVDYTPQASRILWANQAALNVVFCRSLEEVQRIDLNSGMSKALRDHSTFLWKTVQIEQQTHSEIKTVYMKKDQPATYNIVHRPIQIVLPGSEEVRTVILNQWQPVEDTGSEQLQWRLGAELFLQVDIKILCFDVASFEVRFQNPKSSAFYKEAGTKIAHFGDWLDTFDVDDPGVEEKDAAEMKEMLSRFMKDLSLGVPPITFECKSRFTERRSTSSSDRTSIEPSEEAVWHRVRCSPCSDPHDGRTLILVQEFDITELKEIELHLMKEQEDMEQFFASVSHELRSPLNGIIGLASALVSDPACNARLCKTIQLIQSSGQRMVSLVNDIVDSAALKRRTLLVKHESVNLHEAASVVCEILSPIVARKVKLVNAIDDAFPHIEGDYGRLSQILTNLVSNAIKFTHQGTITISARELPSTNQVEISVADTGIGIPEDKLDFLWDAFKQVDTATTRRYGGTGLGLFLVKDLVEAHNGTVDVKSQHGGPEHGSTFSIRIPQKQEPESEPLPSLIPSYSRNRSRTSSCLSGSHEGAAEPPLLSSLSESERAILLGSRNSRSSQRKISLRDWKEKGSGESWKEKDRHRTSFFGLKSPSSSSEDLPRRSSSGSQQGWRNAAAFRHTKGSFRGLADLASENGRKESQVSELRTQIERLTTSLNQERSKHEDLRTAVAETSARATLLAQEVQAEKERAAALEKEVQDLKSKLRERSQLNIGGRSEEEGAGAVDRKKDLVHAWRSSKAFGASAENFGSSFRNRSFLLRSNSTDRKSVV